MEPSEFQTEIGPYVGNLWPGFQLNAVQTEIWFSKLKNSDVPTVKRAVAEAYARSTWKEPQLGDVVISLKDIEKTEQKNILPPIPESRVLEIYETDRQLKIKDAIRNGYSIAPMGTVNANDLKKKGKK